MNQKNILLLLCACVLMSLEHSYARQSPPKISRVISGVIKDVKNNEPLAGVSLLIKGTTNGTTTDEGGKFNFTGPDNDFVLVVSHMGFTQLEVRVNSNTSTLSITMKSAGTSNLDEVVVVGYGTQRKGDVTSAVASVKSDNFVKGYVKMPLSSYRAK